ncbi:Nn.00g066320.m01.CDS01 [Neocucurbitaria sp. VM-36]
MEVAGAAVGVASLGIQLCQGLLQYYVSWKGYKDDIKATYDSIEQFEKTLMLLGKTADRSQHSPELIQRVAECVIACESGINRLKKKFEKIKQKTPSDTTLANLRRQLHLQSHRLIYPFQESTLAKLREIISELQGTILTATSALNIDIASASLEKLDALEHRTASLASDSLVIRSTLDHSAQQTGQILQAQRDLEYEKACAWLAASNPFIEYIKALNEHHPGTGSWFLESEIFQSWETSPGRTCWIHGKPGCGKTVLSSVIVRQLKDHVLRSTNSALAYFFFNFNDKTKTKVHKVIRSLILQISVQMNGGQRELMDFYARHHNTHEELSCNVLMGFLKRLLSFGHVYLVFDALDECEELDQLTEFISDLGSCSDRVHLLVTSRNENCLRGLQTDAISIDINLENEDVRVDLRNFIQENVSGDEELGQWSTDVQLEIIETLIDGADCMFRWAALQIEQLRKCYTLDGLRITLTSLPRGLEDTYVRILSEIPEPNRPVVLKLLYWIMFVEMPLDLAAAAETIKLDINADMFYKEGRRLRNPRTLLRLCPSLITLIPRTEPSDPEYITLSHASVKDFLLSERIRDDSIGLFHISRVRAPLYVTESCVAYMLHVSNEIYDVDATDWYWQMFKKFPLLEYARIFWDTHVRKTHTIETEKLNMLVLEYASSQLLQRLSAMFPSEKPYPADLPPFLRLTELGFVHIMENLLSNGYGVDSSTSEGWDPLSVAVAAERLDAVELLLNSGASLNSKNRPGSIFSICGLSIKMAVGMEMSSNTHVSESIALRLLKAGATLAASEAKEIWHHTLEHADTDTLEVLFRLAHPSLFLLDQSSSLLHYAAHLYFVHLEGMMELQRPESLVTALLRERLEKIQLLLNHGSNAEATDKEGRTVLLFVLSEAATRLGQTSTGFLIDICEVLLNARANIHAIDMQGWMPLNWAAAYLDDEVVYTLLRRGAWPEEMRLLELLSETPLHSAIIHARDESTIRALLEYGVPINVADRQGLTAMEYALQSCDERQGVVQMLFDYGAYFDDADAFSPPEPLGNPVSTKGK